MTASPMPRADVAIIGGGMAGLTLALQLRQENPDLDIRVLERSVLPPPAATHKVGESTVEIGSWYLDRTLGLGDLLEQLVAMLFERNDIAFGRGRFRVRGDVVDLGWWDTGFLTLSGLKSLILPAITLGLYQLTLIMRLVRAEMLEVLRTDYIKFAEARGIPDRSLYFRHALKNTMVPVITITGLQIGSIIAFAIITETVFQWPGMGLLFLQAIQFADIPIMSTYLILIAFFFVVINLIVDLLYHVVDPRLRFDKAMVAGH